MQHVGGLLPGLVDSALRDGHQQVPFSLQTAIAVAAQLATVHESARCERRYMPSAGDAVLGSSAASGVQSGLKFTLAGQQACPWAAAHAGRRREQPPETRAERTGFGSGVIHRERFTQAAQTASKFFFFRARVK